MQKWTELEVSQEALEPVLKLTNTSSMLFSSSAGAIGSHVLLAVTALPTGSVLLAIGGLLAFAGSFFLLRGWWRSLLLHGACRGLPFAHYASFTACACRQNQGAPSGNALLQAPLRAR